jgi:UDP-N-acetylglucosamine--N-acetylmuramyl-(pentapeptide) pyrophosphoryl-undecaprenol N-acetylglucosamine transferase
LSKKKQKICVAYENLERFFPKEKMILTNPVRQDLIDIESKRETIQYFNLDSKKNSIGSWRQSWSKKSKSINRKKELANILSQNVQVIWQCGKLYLEDYKKYNSTHVQVVAFIERMDLVYAAAECYISRAGASSVSELCIVGKPVFYSVPMLRRSSN